MADVGVLGLLKTFSHTQNYLGNIQFVLFNLVWSILIGPVDVYFKEELKCAVDKGKNDNINTLCFKQYSEQYYWPISKQTLAAVNWILVLCTWVVYIVYAISKNNNEHGNEGPPIYARPKVRKFYVGQIIVRALVLLIFIVGIVLIVKMNPRDSGFSFPAHFNCTLEDNTTGGLTTTYVMCPDKYNNEKTVASIAILVLDTLVLILTVYELIVELLRAPSSNNNLEETGLELLNPNSQEDVPESDTCINSLENIPEPSYQELLKEQILSSTQRQKKLFATVHDKSDLLFDDIFTELIVYRGRMSHKLKQHNLYEREGNLWKYAEPDDIKVKLDNVEDLVKPLEEGEVAPRNIFMIGRAGIGKTMFCENIIRGWASNKLYKRRYDYVFLLNFRQLNRIKHDISLRHLLNSSPHTVQLDEATFARITMSSEKLLLIFDGFDEFLDQDNFKEVAESLPDREEEDCAMAVQALYYKLCTGKLLSRATIVTTSRASKALEVINEDRAITNKRTVEILGFDEEKIKEYVRKFCGEDHRKSEAIIEYITSRADLLALCYVPMNCFLVCYCLQTLKVEDISKGALPTTLTALYQRIVRLFIKEHYKSEGEPTAKTEQKPLSDATIEQLSKVAYEGVLKRQLIFDEELKNFPIDELTSCGILHEMPGIVTPDMELSAQYIFIHLTIQEFLAARHIIQKFTINEFQSFALSAVCDPKWEMVLQFIAGLLSPSANFPPKLPAPENQDFKAKDERLTELRHVALFECLKKAKLLLSIKCLFEYHDAAFVKDSVSDIGPKIDLDAEGVTDADCTAISFVCQNAACGSVTAIHLEQNNIGALGCRELKGLLTSDSEIKELNITENPIGDKGAENIKAALQDSNCKLTSLNLSFNNIGDKGAEHIKAALQNSNCKLTSLNLSGNRISTKVAEHMKAAFQDSNCKLRLDISYIEIEKFRSR